MKNYFQTKYPKLGLIKVKIEEYCLFNLVKDFFENNKKKGNENFFKNNEEKYHNIDKNLVLSECKLKNIICSTWLKTSSKIMRRKGLKTSSKIMRRKVITLMRKMNPTVKKPKIA